MKRKIPVSIRLEAGLLAWIDEQAIKEDVTRTKIFTRILKNKRKETNDSVQER